MHCDDQNPPASSPSTVPNPIHICSMYLLFHAYLIIIINHNPMVIIAIAIAITYVKINTLIYIYPYLYIYWCVFSSIYILYSLCLQSVEYIQNQSLFCPDQTHQK